MGVFNRKIRNLVFTGFYVATLSFGAFLFLTSNEEASALRPITFPVIGPAKYSNDYYALRDGGTRVHQAIDIIANKGQPIVSPVDGVITFVPYPQPSYGYMVSIKDSDGFTYNNLHLNDDNPGTNDGNGGAMNAYMPDIKSGNRVVGGQQIGWLGDSGRAGSIPHLHFEIENPDGSRGNPYGPLNESTRIPWPVIPPALSNEILPYGLIFRGGLNIDMGNFDGDQKSELVTGAGPGGGGHVKVFDNDAFTGVELMAYNPRLPIGADVAAGDVDGDGIDEIITGPGPGGGPHVRIFKTNAQEVNGFYAYNPSFTGGVRVAAGDVDGDGIDEIITGAGPSGGPHVRVFESDGSLISEFFAYAPSFKGGIDVASADLTGSSSAEIVISPGPGGGPQVRTFQPNGTALSSFFAYEASFTGGVRVSAGDIRPGVNKAEIVTVPARNGGPHMRMFNSTGGSITSKMFMEEWWYGYNDVAAGYDASKAGTGGNRRASVKFGLD